MAQTHISCPGKNETELSFLSVEIQLPGLAAAADGRIYPCLQHNELSDCALPFLQNLRAVAPIRDLDSDSGGIEWDPPQIAATPAGDCGTASVLSVRHNQYYFAEDTGAFRKMDDTLLGGNCNE